MKPIEPIYLIDELEEIEDEIKDEHINPHGMNGSGNNDNSHTIDG